MSGAIATTGGSRPASPHTPQKSTGRAEQARTILGRSRDQLEKVFRVAEAMQKAITSPGAWQELSKTTPLGLRLADVGTVRSATIAREWIQNLPPRGEIDAALDAVRAALQAEADERSTTGMVGLLLACFPNSGKDTREVYVATIVHDLMGAGHGPHIVAESCRVIRHDTRFTPAVSEFLAASESARYRLASAEQDIARALVVLDRVDEILRVDALPPDERPDNAWLALALEWRRTARGFRQWPAHLGLPPDQVGTLYPNHLRSAAQFPDLTEAAA